MRIQTVACQPPVGLAGATRAGPEGILRDLPIRRPRVASDAPRATLMPRSSSCGVRLAQVLRGLIYHFVPEGVQAARGWNTKSGHRVLPSGTGMTVG
jgi:hypothetical protein